MRYLLAVALLAFGLNFSVMGAANAASMPLHAGIAAGTSFGESAVTPVRGWWAVPVIVGGVILYHHHRHYRRCYRRCYRHRGHRHCRCYY